MRIWYRCLSPLKRTDNFIFFNIARTDVELDFHCFLLGSRKDIELLKGKRRGISMQQKRKSHSSHWKRYVAASRKMDVLCPGISHGLKNESRYF